ncbi:MAG: ATP phosphoribosyltransferase [Firmicutes bacterium]|nr:ATP phosphoribosyltransferase [Bacillota bacterium]
MQFDEKVLRNDELAVFRLRALYQQYGYTRFKMSKFEEYDLYVRNKDFLISDSVITFNDLNGKLLALKPDVTLSIVKNTPDVPGTVQRVYYNESIYRPAKGSRSFKEIMQTGLECLGAIDSSTVCEVVLLALKSLEAIRPDFVLDISHMGLVSAIMDDYFVPGEAQKKIVQYISDKNVHDIRKLADEYYLAWELIEQLTVLVSSYGKMDEVIPKLEAICTNEKMRAAIDELKSLAETLEAEGFSDHVNLDFSIVNDMNYYSGIVFKGYLQGIPTGALSGGRYDNLMQKMGRNAGAIGFAVYLDVLERLEEPEESEAISGEMPEKAMINVALPKGRLGESVYELFDKAGFECPSIKEEGRKLVFESEKNRIRYFWVKPSDVHVYVERGVADIGVVGKDILLENEPDVYELLDLDIGKCRMAVAAKTDFRDDTEKTLRVATTFPNIARDFYTKKGREIDIIKLNGSIEIAPLLDLSDVIVDLVETGNTLKANGLEPIETIVPISARLIANKAGFKFKTREIEAVRDGLAEQIEGE